MAFSDDMCLSGGGSWHTKNQNVYFYTHGFVYNKIIPYGWNTIYGRWSRHVWGLGWKIKDPSQSDSNGWYINKSTVDMSPICRLQGW